MKIFAQTITVLKDYFSNRERSYSRIIQFTKISVIINAVIALGKIGMGIYSPSFFLCINGFYNIGIGAAKAVAVKGLEANKKLPDNAHPSGYQKEEYRCYLLVGIIVSLAGFMYSIYKICTLSDTHSNMIYSGLMVVTIGVFTGIEIILSLRGIFEWRRHRKPVIEAIKMTNLVSAMISLVLTQTAILSHAGRSSTYYMNLAGVVFGALSVGVGMYMIVSMYRTIYGKGHAAIIKKANRIVQKHVAEGYATAFKYEDNGPAERILYLQVSVINSATERAMAEIEAKMNLDVKYIDYGEPLIKEA